MKRLILAAALSLAFATPALASQCPADVAKIDAALAGSPTQSAEQLAEVKTLRDEGEALHNAGSHAESVETLAKAKAILGIE
jgi:hypothetical protein